MSILIKPISTEKASTLGDDNRYVFQVKLEANKIQVKNEVEQTYGVTVKAVNTMIVPGKVKRKFAGSRVIVGKTSKHKKAVVEIAEGDIIDFYRNL